MCDLKNLLVGSAAAIAVTAGGAAAQEAGYLYRTVGPDGQYYDLTPRGSATHSVARQWNEVLLECIRNDKARPTVHARNLFHTSAAMMTTKEDQVSANQTRSMPSQELTNPVVGSKANCQASAATTVMMP